MKRTFLLLFVALGLSVFINAQDFSGNWVQQSKQHVSGPEYTNAIQKKMTINQRPDSILIISVNTGADGQDITGRQAICTNGKPFIISNKASRRKYSISTAWSADKKTLTIITIFSMSDNENETDFTRVETWILSADGKQLNVDKKSIETRSETWEVKAMFTKQ